MSAENLLEEARQDGLYAGLKRQIEVLENNVRDLCHENEKMAGFVGNERESLTTAFVSAKLTELFTALFEHPSKIVAIRTYRELTNLGMQEVKTIIDNLPVDWS